MDMSMIKLDARGESFRINQVAGNLFVCAEENGGCCCGHAEKGRAIVNKDLYGRLWEDRKLRNTVHLTFVGCLGPCPIGNNAMLIMHGRAIWFKDLNDDRFIPMIFDYIEAMQAAGKVIPPTGELASHVYERYLPAPDQEALSFGSGEQAEMDFEGIDPVCMMTVDPATAQWQSEYEGKAYYFCAPSCKRSFDKDPAAYVGAKVAPLKDAPAAPAREAASPIENTKTFVVPNISCDHCTRSIRNEVNDIAGVQSVQADSMTKVVTVVWQAPASWDEIKARLTEIDYPPQDLAMPA
jgi:cobaltochelatase CobN